MSALMTIVVVFIRVSINQEIISVIVILDLIHKTQHYDLSDNNIPSKNPLYFEKCKGQMS